MMTNTNRSIKQKKRVMIIEDHPLFREGLKQIIEKDPKYEIIGECSKGRDAAGMVEACKPDLVLMDMSLPDQSGIELIPALLNISRKMRVLVVSMHFKVDYIIQAFQAGARGYSVKESAPGTLLYGMEQLSKGHYFIDPIASEAVIQKLIGLPAREATTDDAGYETLSAREKEVMVLLAEGQTTKEIADRLFISAKTAENHRYHIMKKLGVHSIMELMRYAARIGIIHTELWKG